MVSLAPPAQMLAPPPPRTSRKHCRDEDSSTSHAPIKTKRVRFAELGPNPTLEPPAPPTANGKQKRRDADLTTNIFKKFVENAIEERALGRSNHYEDLRRKFQADPGDDTEGARPAPSSQEMQMVLAALTGVVSRLDAGCARLVEDVVETVWLGRDDMFVNAYVKFLGNLVSAHANYMGVVAGMLVRNLCFCEFCLVWGWVGRLC